MQAWEHEANKFAEELYEAEKKEAQKKKMEELEAMRVCGRTHMRDPSAHAVGEWRVHPSFACPVVFGAGTLVTLSRCIAGNAMD